MSLTEETRDKIESVLDQNRVVLFMKGTPQHPQCGFSAKTSGMLSSILPEYETIDVLEDNAVREGIKEFGNWPTIPQLYIKKELVGGCDIVTQLFNTGELHELLGVEKPDRTPPDITITDQAADNIRAAMADNQGLALHFSIDGNWQSQFSLAPEEGHEIAAEANAIRILMDINSAQRARGAVIDWVDSLQGQGLTIDLPGAPAPVRQMSVQQLKQRLDADDGLWLVDIRNEDERSRAGISQAKILDQALMQEIERLPKETPLAFLCHHGNSSQGAAEHYRRLGFTEVFNVAGGINAWSLEVDSEVPQY